MDWLVHHAQKQNKSPLNQIEYGDLKVERDRNAPQADSETNFFVRDDIFANLLTSISVPVHIYKSDQTILMLTQVTCK